MKGLEAVVNAKLWNGMFVVCVLVPSSLAFGQRVRLPEGTAVRVRLKADLVSDKVAPGTRVDLEVSRPVIVQGTALIPVGAIVWGAVQSVKKGKFVKFDIEGLRLPDLTEIALRSTAEKAKNPGEFKVESTFPGGVGAAKGTEYTAYVDVTKEVAALGSIGNSEPAVGAAAQPTARPATAPAGAGGATQAATTPSEAPGSPPAISPGPSASPVANVERIKVECFSDPSAADILIDGEFYGNTPSILRVPAGKHQLEIQLAGYKTFKLPLILQPGSGVRTIRATLEQKE